MRRPRAVYSSTTDAIQVEPPSGIDVQFVLSGHLKLLRKLPLYLRPVDLVLPGFLAWHRLSSFLGFSAHFGCGMVFVFVLGLLAAHLSLKINSRLKGVLDSLFTIRWCCLPQFVGFASCTVWNSTAIGRWLIDHGISLVFSWPAAVLAAIVVSFPLMYRTARGAF